MESSQLEIIKAVLQRYDLQSDGMEAHPDGGWRIYTDKGVRWLREDTDPERVKRRYVLSEQLAYAGYRRTPRAIRDREGAAVVQEDGRFFWLARDLQGRRAGYSSADLHAAGRNLGFLHQALEHVRWPAEVELPQQAGEWKQKFLLSSARMRKMEAVFPHAANALAEGRQLADLAVRELDAFQYEAWCRQEPVRQSICLSDYGIGLVRILSDGTAAMADIQQAVWDCKAYDLGRMFLQLSEIGRPDLAGSLLAGYEERRAISCPERQWLQAYLAFPHFLYLTLLRSFDRQNRALLQGQLIRVQTVQANCLEIRRLLQQGVNP